jgi:MoaA/NifB/PqqE/SkfB family radical SAM enzyme
MGLLYTRMKVFHYKDKLDSLPKDLEAILPPVQVRIKPTNICNHNCWYCAYRADKLQLGQDMNRTDSIPREKMIEILDDIISMGVKSVTFSGGGEPFCYPHLLEAATKLASSGVKFAALTNGSRLSGEVARVFAEHATWLRVSMDGWNDASYRKYRGCPDGEFTRIIGNVERFKKLTRTCFLGVCIVVDQHNYTHLHELIGILKDCGVNSVKVSPCIISNTMQENHDYHLPLFETVKQQTQRAQADFTDSGFEIYDAYHYSLGTFAKAYHWCPYLQIVPVIGADLNVYSCHDKAYNLKEGLLGSIGDTRFRNLWFSDKKRFFQIDPSRYCNHHCVVDSNNRMIMEYLDADRAHLEFV